MKVCTDACIFGSLVSFNQPRRILDIGSGTGLLSLMLAQKYSCPIDAVEIHEPSWEEAKSNINNSQWSNRIQVYCQSIQEFKSAYKYDLIVSNPPFFQSNKKAKASERNLALHNDSLPFSDIVKSVLRLMSVDGVFYVLLPPFESSLLSKMMLSVGLHVTKLYRIRNFVDTPIFREVTAFSNRPESGTTMELVIYKQVNQYTDDFIALLSPYYLNL